MPYTYSNFRLNPITGAYSERTITDEAHTVAEFDFLPGVHGILLKDRPNTDPAQITIIDTADPSNPFTVITSGTPTAGQVRVFQSGVIVFNISDTAKNIEVDYKGRGSNTSLENLQALVGVPVSSEISALTELTSLDNLDEFIINDVSTSTTKKLTPDTLYENTVSNLLSSASKTDLDTADNFFIEDSDTSSLIKKTTLSNLTSYLDSIINPVGTVRETARKTASSSAWKICDGSAISRTTYADLFNAISPNLGTFTVTIATPAVGTLNSHGILTGESVYLTTTGALPTGLSANTLYYLIAVDTNTFRLATSRANALAGTAINTSGSQSGTHSLYFCPFGLGDGSTTFNIPDLIGATPSGRGLSTGYTQNITRVMGYKLDDAIQGHYHRVENGSNAGYFSGGVPFPTTGTGGYNTDRITIPITDGTNGTPRTANETRGKIMALNYEIKIL